MGVSSPGLWVVRSGVVGIAALLCAGCPPRRVTSGGGDASTADASTGPTAATGANAADVTRYPDEAAVDNASFTLTTGGVNARASLPLGEGVAVLPKGTAVTEIASRGRFALVVFSDPQDATRQLMAWVPRSAMGGAPVPAPTSTTHTPTKKCAPGEDDFAGQGCKRACTDDEGCSAEDNCGGKGTIVGSKESARFCEPDGAPTAKDAGGGGGGGTTPPPPSSFVVNPSGTACPAGYAMAADTKCHKTCNTSVTECLPPPQAYCINNKGTGGGRVCSATR